jgi:hypothetical protein
MNAKSKVIIEKEISYVSQDVVGRPAGLLEAGKVLDVFHVNSIWVKSWGTSEGDLENLDEHFHGSGIAKQILLEPLDFASFIQEGLESLQGAGNELSRQKKAKL